MINSKLLSVVALIGLVMEILKVLAATTLLTEVLLWITFCVLTGFILAKKDLTIGLQLLTFCTALKNIANWKVIAIN